MKGLTENQNLENQNGQQEGGETLENQSPAWHAEAIKWANENGREIADVNDLLKPTQVEIEKEVVKEVNPWEDVMDERTKGYLNYRKETGRDWDDYNKLQQDIDKIPALELAREKVRMASPNVKLTNEQIDEYLEEELQISLGDKDNYKAEMKLDAFTRDERNAMKSEQEKYRTPVEKKNEQPSAYNPDNYVALPDGSVMTKEQFAERENKINEHIGHLRGAVGGLKTQSFSIEVEENGEKREIPFTYDFSAEEIDGMSDFAEGLVTGKIVDKYRTENGIDYAGFVKDLLVNPITGKMIPKLLQSAHAIAIEEVMKQNGNHNFTAQLPPTSQRDGVKIVSFEEIAKRL